MMQDQRHVAAIARPAPPDIRPSPQPFPTIFILTWWDWARNESSGSGWWRMQYSKFPLTHREAVKKSSDLHAQGCRTIRIIEIPGEPQ